MSQEILIKNISIRENNIELEWNDDQISNFHFMWLRDNCPLGMHLYARHRTFNFLTVSEKIYPESCSLTNGGKLEIIWSEGNHISQFDPKWLRNHCYTINNKKKYKSPYILWDKDLGNNFDKITVEFNKIINDDNELIKWLEQLHYYGFSLVKGAPNKANAIALLEFLIQPKAQTLYSSINYEYPVNPTMSLNEELQSWGEFKEDKLPIETLAELAPTAQKIIDRVGW